MDGPKTTQRMGGRHRGLGQRHTTETVPFDTEQRIKLTLEAYEHEVHGA